MTREINDQTPGRPGCDGNDRSRGMSDGKGFWAGVAEGIAMALFMGSIVSIVSYAAFGVRWWVPIEAGNFREFVLLLLHIAALMLPFIVQQLNGDQK